MLPGDLVSEEEVKMLVDSAVSVRDKAFIITLYESGARIGEVGMVRIKDVVFEERYTTVMVKGKTGSRRIIVVASTPFLTRGSRTIPSRTITTLLSGSTWERSTDIER